MAASLLEAAIFLIRLNGSVFRINIIDPARQIGGNRYLKILPLTYCVVTPMDFFCVFNNATGVMRLEIWKLGFLLIIVVLSFVL